MIHAAEEKEWNDWLKNKSVRVAKGKEAEEAARTVPSSRIINLCFVYTGKNASIRAALAHLRVQAKARMCARGLNEPSACEGLVKLDGPTVQRLGIVFFQLVANFSWYGTWRKGDISSAVLQGTERDSSKGCLFLRPPRDRPLAGVDSETSLKC